jgi:hypothetical protein
MTIGRRRFLQGAAVLGAAAATGALPAAAGAEEDGPRQERVTFDVPDLDPAHDGLRIAQLSDVHVGPRTPPALIRRAVDLANALEPDLVVLTGDYVTRSRGEVEGMRTLLAGLAAPTVAVLGNHDVWVDLRGSTDALRANGYEVLENAWTRVTLRGAPLAVVGVGDRRTGRDDVPAAVRGLPAGAAPIVLAHSPRTSDRLRELHRPLVCFAGHTHGGQVNIPIITPIALAFVREPYARGRFRLGDVQLYVNRGVGMSGISVRIDSPPEVTLATLRRVEPGAGRRDPA